MRDSMEGFRLLILHSFLFSSLRIATTSTLDTITLGQSIRDGETVVSADQRFELGFFSPGTSRSRYLGIWYKQVAPMTTVWVANRDTPISDPSGVLYINTGGILVLLNSTKDIVWSSNASRSPENPVAVLLGSGNLAVKDGNDNNPDNFLWQSFDHPGDTLLPGMKLGINLVTGLEWFLTSWKSNDDPSQGEFTVIINPHGFPQLFLKKGPVILGRAGSWNGLRWTGSLKPKPNSIYSYNFVSNEKEVFYTYDIQDSSVLSRVVLTPSGVLQRFTGFDKTTRTWVEHSSANGDECDNYAKCGAHAICNIYNFPACTCFEKFKPKSQLQWSIFNWSAGCVRKAPLDCKHGDGFLKLEAIKLPDTSHSRTEKYISLVECKKSCLSNCSCTAYTTLDIREGGSGCLLWFNDLIDIKDIEGGQDLYVRVAASELGNIESRRQPSGKKPVNVIIIVASIISGMGALVLAWMMYMRTKLKNKGMKLGWDLKTGVERYLTSWKSADDPSYGDFTYRLDIHVLPQIFTYNGSTKMAHTGPWNGIFFGGVPESPNFIFELNFVHDKNEIYYMYESFNNPVIMLTKITHSGFFQRLIWKERGSIWDVVVSAPNDLCEYYGKCSANGVCSIDKAPICECLQGFIPESQQNQTSPTRCVRSSPFHCRSGDRFIKLTGLKLPDLVETSLNDTMSLQECESKCLKNCSCKAYANSIVSGGGRGCLMWSGDLIDIRKHVDEISDLNENRRQKIIVAVLVISGILIFFSLLFCIWKKTTKKGPQAWLLWKETRALELMDSCLADSCVQSQVLKCVQVGLLCVQKFSDDRPAMSTVVFMLANKEAILPQPRQPGFFTERSSVDMHSTSRTAELHTDNSVTISTLEGR
ncbi:hypothetical protein EZV62_008473 [Acer yangbiense]|uniref:Receptor-like serine/threonine-protein kinase n=1 Tax=Acer yangbiense TaxID=1000413 RepID=A0A5C7IDS6_9ROSI|nr:hypothetical protein EZV62_008473 [Acer yangbiense]